MALAVLALLLAIIIAPPLISIQSYKGRITGLISRSLNRPVRLSSVELRLLPRPGFVLTDLTVEEDPAYGAEPILHANTVTASIRLLSLWRGVELSRISVDEASLNLVRTANGRWNVDSLLRTAANPAAGADGPGRRHVPLPYMEATESRINIKDGAEKLPFSIVNADLSFWQEEPGEWRIRLRGQPARTDLSLDTADTGQLRLTAELHRAAELRNVPMQVDAEWSEAQLGQLTRLALGSDSGWRGNLTGELHMQGTADAAKIQARLRAEGVHRAEFAPAEAMDFDASCSLTYHSSMRAAEGLECNSPVGDGRVRLTGGMPGGRAPHFSLELDRLPVALALDALRTVRSGFGSGLEAKGTVSGKVSYDESASAEPPERAHAAKAATLKSLPPAPGQLAGNFTVQGFELSGDGLKQPIRINKMVLEPVAGLPGQPQGQFNGLSATAQTPAGGQAPLVVSSRLTASGYQITLRGQAGLARIREMAHLAGADDNGALAGLTGDVAQVDLSAEGPWLAPQLVVLQPGSEVAKSQAGADRLTGSLSFHNANWTAEFLANPIEIAQATLHIDGQRARWDPVVFSYGGVKGTADLTAPLRCETGEECPPEFEIDFGSLNAGTLEAAILGARKPGTLISDLIARLSPTHAPAWPRLNGTVKADSLELGPVTVEKPSATIRIHEDRAEITAFGAGISGGSVEGTGAVQAAGANGNKTGKPVYTLEGTLTHLKPAEVGKLVGERWSGGELEGNGKIELSGYTGKDLAASAAGNLHFEWRRGSVAAGAARTSSTEEIPLVLERFDRWTADAAIANGAISVEQSEVQRGAHRSPVAATVTFAAPLNNISFASQKQAETARK
jgi:uncharacterized protein involved in outer membrane biogenesis